MRSEFMPLHDWARTPDWFSVHQIWAGEIAGQLNQRLPRRFRASLGPVPGTAGIGIGIPDAHVRDDGPPDDGDDDRSLAASPHATPFPPEAEGVLAETDVETGVFIFERGVFVTAIELISPGNKDRPDRRDATAARYFNFFKAGANLVVVDVHPQPDRPTLPDTLGERFGLNRPPLPAPYVICYRVSGERNPGRRVQLWSRPLSIEAELPEIPVPLLGDLAVKLGLEETYSAAVTKSGLD